MARQPTLKQLKYLTALAELEHFGKAAAACYVSQSTLSAAILELEDILGSTLVERNKRQLILTPLGQDVVERGRAILMEVDDLVALCAASGEPFSGKMRLGVIPTIAPYILPHLLKRLRRKYPEFQLFIREELSAHLVTALQHGELDVLLLALPYPGDNVETMHLFEDEFVFACPGDHALAHAEHVCTADLRQQDLLLLEDGHCLRDHALEACKLSDSDLSIPYQATSLNTIVQMVANGIGVTLLPQMALDAKILSGTGVRTRLFHEHNVARSIGLMWRHKSPRRDEFTLLGEFIAGAVGNT
jgi:LysR family hydrogen peroxide-inducible transcriptional activator